jgi:hypothetical protein
MIIAVWSIVPVAYSTLRQWMCSWKLDFGLNEECNRTGCSSGRILSLLGSSFEQDTEYADWSLSWFISVPPDECWDSNLDLVTTASFKIRSSSSAVILSGVIYTRYWWSRWVTHKMGACSCKITKTVLGSVFTPVVGGYLSRYSK